MVTAAQAGFPFDFAVVVEPGLDMEASPSPAPSSRTR
jgi:hypothetical protein